MKPKVLGATFVALVAAAVPARAEIVFLQSGRTLSVKGHRYDGEAIIFSLRNGGTVTCDRSLIQRIVPDEVSYEEPRAEEAQGQDAQPGAELRTLEEGTPYGEIIAALSQAHGVDPVLVSAVIKVESGYRPRARSRRGAMGLMQLMPSTARAYKVRNPFDPKANIEAGVKHLKSLIDRFDGGIDLALAAYNAGEAAVKKFNGIPPYRETRNYVSRILAIAGIR